jgi:hypothetical protein
VGPDLRSDGGRWDNTTAISKSLRSAATTAVHVAGSVTVRNTRAITFGISNTVTLGDTFTSTECVSRSNTSTGAERLTDSKCFSRSDPHTRAQCIPVAERESIRIAEPRGLARLGVGRGDRDDRIDDDDHGNGHERRNARGGRDGVI